MLIQIRKNEKLIKNFSWLGIVKNEFCQSGPWTLKMTVSPDLNLQAGTNSHKLKDN